MKALTHEEIRERLRNMVVGENGVLPLKAFSFIVKNPNYDPDTFSQEIEDSEVKINVLDEIKKEIHRPVFDFIWHNTLSDIPHNSEEWEKNHSKICKAKFLPCAFLSPASTTVVAITSPTGEVIKDTIRHYDNKVTMDKVLKIEQEYGEIYDMI